jgi:hypothetical protein
MIDLIYKTLQTIINKENNGYVSPTEFNILANNVQNEIFRGYFEDENKDKIKENKGYTNKGYANLAFNERQRIDQFSAFSSITTDGEGKFNLPSDLYFIEDDGIIQRNVNEVEAGNVVEEVERSVIGYLNRSISAPSLLYPVYERYGDYVIIYPSSVSLIDLRYLRTPKMPTWTYFVTGAGNELFDSSNTSFQDFELHESEFSNIINRMLTYFGINLREAEIVQIAETLKDKLTIKDNN